MHKNCANENIWRIAILKRLIQLADVCYLLFIVAQ